jgi:hypothetical protein
MLEEFWGRYRYLYFLRSGDAFKVGKGNVSIQEKGKQLSS